MTPFDWVDADKAPQAVAGLSGGIVRWATLGESWKDGLLSVLVGGICAYYLAPLILPMMEPSLGKISVTPDKAATISGFLVGVGGVGLAGWVIDFWRIRKSKGRS